MHKLVEEFTPGRRRRVSRKLKPAMKSNRLKEFQPGPSKPSDQFFVLQLYVSGASPKSLQAITNIRKICDENLSGRCHLEVVDIYPTADHLR